jgi:hypothetical protein
MLRPNGILNVTGFASIRRIFGPRQVALLQWLGAEVMLSDSSCLFKLTIPYAGQSHGHARIS